MNEESEEEEVNKKTAGYYALEEAKLEGHLKATARRNPLLALDTHDLARAQPAVPFHLLPQTLPSSGQAERRAALGSEKYRSGSHA